MRHFEAILTDPKQLEGMLGVTVFDDGLDFSGVASMETMRFLYKHLKDNPDVLGWWMYLFVHAEDRVLIGQGGRIRGRRRLRASWTRAQTSSRAEAAGGAISTAPSGVTAGTVTGWAFGSRSPKRS